MTLSGASKASHSTGNILSFLPSMLDPVVEYGDTELIMYKCMKVDDRITTVEFSINLSSKTGLQKCLANIFHWQKKYAFKG